MAKAKNNAGAQSNGPDSGSLDKVRDILFGEQTRRSTERFDQLEGRLTQDIAKTHAAQKASLEALKKAQQEKLAQAVALLEASAKSGAGEQAAGLKAIEAQLTGQVAELESAIEAGQEKLRGEVDAQHEALRADLQAAREAHEAEIQALSAELRGAMVDREQLAELFGGLAQALGNKAGGKRKKG
ncbi:MAG: hypothetical protein V3V20_09405 [Algisphaera sp.]